jgi:hypothetical protein
MAVQLPSITQTFSSESNISNTVLIAAAQIAFLGSYLSKQ